MMYALIYFAIVIFLLFASAVRFKYKKLQGNEELKCYNEDDLAFLWIVGCSLFPVTILVLSLYRVLCWINKLSNAVVTKFVELKKKDNGKV